jgi:hypothetical protein
MVTASEVIGVVSTLISAQVFLIGFASVRNHSHLDRTLARYDDLVDRSVTLSLQTTSFPTPRQIKRIEETIFSKSTDWSRWAVIAISIGVTLLGFGLTAGFIRSGTLKSSESALAMALSALIALFLLVLAVDTYAVSRQFRRGLDGAIYRLYELGSGRVQQKPSPLRRAIEAIRNLVCHVGSPRGDSSNAEPTQAHGELAWSKRRELLEDVNLQLPRWPWAMLELADLLRVSDLTKEREDAKALAEEVVGMMRDGYRHLDVEKMDLGDLAVYWWATLLSNPNLVDPAVGNRRLADVSQRQYPDCVYVYKKIQAVLDQ